jgi:hypothetical protein
MSQTHAELAALQSAIEGQVVLPNSAAYEDARKPAFAQYAHIRPAAIVRCRTPADVVEAVALARRLGLTTAMRSGGHCFAGRSTTRGVMIDVGPLRSVELQGTAATIEARDPRGDLRRARGRQPNDRSRLLPDGRDRGADSRRRSRHPRPYPRAHRRSAAGGAGRSRGRSRRRLRRGAVQRPVLGAAGRRRRTVRRRHPVRVQDSTGACAHLLSPGLDAHRSERRARRMANVGAEGSGRARRQPASEHVQRPRAAAHGHALRGHARHEERER